MAGTATALPFPDASFDVVFSAFGALQFVADAALAVAEAARVLRPGGLFAFSVTHPVRWTMPDDPTRAGLVVTSSYWDRTPYVEQDDAGRVTYVEHHRTLGDWVGLLAGEGFRIDDLLEPEWPEGHDRVWGGWGPERGALVPGTAIFSRHPDVRVARRGADLRRRPFACLRIRSGACAARTPRRRHPGWRDRRRREPGCGRPRRRRP